MKLLALDPGGTTGFAIFETSGLKWQKEKQGCRTEKAEVYDLMSTICPDIIVCEDFRLYPWKSNQQAWSQLNTVRLIGAVEYYCHEKQIPLHLQSVQNRDIGYKWGQVRRVSKSNIANHAFDAEAHAVYYIVKNGGAINA